MLTMNSMTPRLRMERKIGERFKYEDVSIKCVKSQVHDNCDKCYFKRDIGCTDKHSVVGSCSKLFRRDHTEVHFVIAHSTFIEADE